MESGSELTRDVDQLADKDQRAAALAALYEAGPAALEAIREGLSHPDWEVRRRCAMFLDRHWDAPSLQRLLLTLYDPKRKVRLWAVHSLGCDMCKGGENPIDAVPHLAERLREDKSIRVRRMALVMLAIQPPDKRIAGILRRTLRDQTDAKLRMFAKWGLHRYEQSRSAALSAPAHAPAHD
jgi:HEAT repeat protein